ncbi:FadR family transcriptional regulator [Herbiconiux sp. CPCC 203407]|uniref:FadR family transcriptional regulator n=1 Tax=Herbiconiux oxytropis TaxID=2970915 RepID=A0AA41XE38_9MICO|nr:FadR/GntR family transcriptional regulator [Herbiconiux oxytropis]MCS5722549.1 FadR family transcriptional regulator [Herbiconiux oxytropis]MCS5726489.1 FadR family transcriptional regulator [Herbiconiux oxytropis]
MAASDGSDTQGATTPRAGRPPRARNVGIEGLGPIVIVPSEPASNEIARALIDYIRAGHVGPGEKLPSERQLSESLGVGRSTIREALKSLGLLGLIEFRHGGGTYYRGADSDLLPRVIEWGLLLGERHTTDLVEARQHLERITSGLAAQRRDDHDLLVIGTALDAMRDARTTEQFVDADVAFHLAIADASGNVALANMLKSIAALLRVWIHRVMDAESSFEVSYLEHVPVLAAIREGDPVAATAAMESHMDRASGRLLSTLSASER